MSEIRSNSWNDFTRQVAEAVATGADVRILTDRAPDDGFCAIVGVPGDGEQEK